ncbi:MAG TPA: hypothetical protein VK897_16350 [Anaerolineales bacterium]|nr:hypothetical protein [Anaerolineales bacterium]
MYPQSFEELPPPPGVMGSLRAGFDAVSTHVSLILLPLVLDIFLWLGPRLSVYGLVNPFLKMMFDRAQQTLTSSTDVQRFAEFQALFNELFQRFNLLSLLGKLQLFPIGVSSLLAQTMPVETPLGEQQVVQISSVPGVMGLGFVLVLAGWVLGGLYFRWVSGIILGERSTAISSVQAILQTLILSVIWVIGLMMFFVPVMFILTVVTMISPTLASIAFFVLLLFSFWLVVPLFFTPHGIFIRKQNAFYSIFTSLRMARFALPTSGLFVLSWFLLTIGLNYLWSVPPEDSWMTLVGIGGHAFITTALLAASFVYYRDMNIWLQTVLEKLQKKQGIPTQRV